MNRPIFCADCGARIARARWRLWTSRKFCQNCEARSPVTKRIFSFGLICATLLTGGFLAGRALHSNAPPVIIERGAISLDSVGQSSTTASGETQNANNSAATQPPRDDASGADREAPTDPAEIVSICGARTQRGTPCSRRVRGTGRCWQHRGRTAMLAPERLIVRETQ